jgi:hypothetical protein
MKHVPTRSVSADGLPMKRSNRRQVLDCASLLALLERRPANRKRQRAAALQDAIALSDGPWPVQWERSGIPGKYLASGTERGVALVITLIMLSVITIMAVAFLVIARSERAGVTQAASQTDSELAATDGFEQAKAQIIGQILARSNLHGNSYAVSRNFINPLGFRNGINDPTNVNFEVMNNGSPVTGNNALLNLLNLFYSPRVPVYVRSNSSPNAPLDFRFYYDRNRNGRYDTNGFVGLVDNRGNVVQDTNGMVRRFLVGDPEWIGILEKPEFPHSRTNRFVARFAYEIVPTGNAMDLNFIHNQTPNRQISGGVPFSRNEGFGTWEINLAAFLRDLNTNVWTTYSYTPVAGGNAFDDALALLQYRFNGGAYPAGNSVQALFGPAGVNAFRQDAIDGYGNGPLMVGANRFAPTLDDDLPAAPWPGGDSLRRFFDLQELYSISGPLVAFTNRLQSTLTARSTYDQTTFARLASQLTTDSDGSDATFIPPATGKINLNWDNTTTNVFGVASPTNFFAWSATNFFRVVGDRLLLDYFEQNSGIMRWPYTNVLSTSFIPLAPTNFYIPAVHRLLQMAANMYDASTNSPYPSVFRPVFGTTGAGQPAIIGYYEDPNANTVPAYNNANVYGVPMVIGTKKGFPNFNEVSMSTSILATRKIELRRPNLNFGTRPNETNQMFILSISNLFGVEAWNSYSTNTYPGGAFTGPVTLSVGNAMTLSLTNQDRLQITIPVSMAHNMTTSSWPVKQFKIPLLTNVVFLSNAVYRASSNPPRFDGLTNVFERNIGFPTPDFGLVISNRLNYTLSQDGRILDYVVLNDIASDLDITSALIRPSDRFAAFEPPVVSGVWLTNRLGNSASFRVPTMGIVNQMAISLGQQGISLADWNSFSLQNASGRDKEKSIQFFQGYVGGSNQAYFSTNGLPTPTALAYQAPFSPTRRLYQTTSWQANDPLVHYTAADLRDRTNNTSIQVVRPTDRTITNSNLGMLNDRYRPWGGHPNKDPASDRNAFLLSVKDPGVYSSDDWNFPAGKYPNIGWLGRVHRGTPWQTIYLKSEVAPMGQANFGWFGQSGGAGPIIARTMHPSMDWRLMDLFTVAQHPNAIRGALSVNQSEIASWSAVLSGVTVLSNTTPISAFGGLSNAVPQFEDWFIEPNSPQLRKIVDGINQQRARRRNQVFERMGEILSVPELTVNSPFLDRSTTLQQQYGLNDAAYERIPQQILSLLKLDEPRFVVYAYGQSLKPAPSSILISGPNQFLGLCTNYQVTGEVIYRAVVKAEGDPVGNPRATPPQPPRVRLTVESFNIVPPE